MTAISTDKFWVSIALHNGFIYRHNVHFEFPGSLVDAGPARKTKLPISSVNSQQNIKNILRNFVSEMYTYKQAHSINISLASFLTQGLRDKKLKEFLDKNSRPFLNSSENDREFQLYELDNACLSGLVPIIEEIKSYQDGSKRLPGILTIGLISTYDAYVGNLIAFFLKDNWKILSGSEKAISFEEIEKYNSIDELKQAIISKEVETILRESHQKQFNLMENKFKLKLREGLDVWPSFVELTQRRNLLEPDPKVLAAARR